MGIIAAAAAPLPQPSFFYTSHCRSDPRSNPPNSVILCERIKEVGNLKAKGGSWKLISYDFGAEDPPRHVGNEGFRIFGERGERTRKVRKKRKERRKESSAHANVLLGDVGARKSSLVLRFVKEQFVEFQQSEGIPASDIDSGSMSKRGRLTLIHKNCFVAA